MTGCASGPGGGNGVWSCAARARVDARTHVPVHVIRDVDGDTLLVRFPHAEIRYVRLIGIDTPEDVRPDYPVECGARGAAASMRRMVSGRGALLVADRTQARIDRYGRILAHVYVGHRQLELAQLRKGWAFVYVYDGRPFGGISRFRAAQSAARFQGRGVWSLCGGDFHSAEPGRQD